MIDIKILPCACNSNLLYPDCCGRFLDNNALPDTSENLMRSRYTAYTRNREAYLLATWHHTTRPFSLELAQQPSKHWLGLTIKNHMQSDADHAMVDFIARYKINGKAYRLHEISRFVREQGVWFYMDGDILDD